MLRRIRRLASTTHSEKRDSDFTDNISSDEFFLEKKKIEKGRERKRKERDKKKIN